MEQAGQIQVEISGWKSAGENDWVDYKRKLMTGTQQVGMSGLGYNRKSVGGNERVGFSGWR